MTKNVTIKILENESEINKEIIKKFSEFIQATIDVNLDYLKHNLLENSYLQHMSGYKQTANEWFNQMQIGSMKYFSNNVLNHKINANDDEYVFVADMILRADIYHFGRHDWHMQMSVYFDNNLLIKKIITKAL